MSLAAPRSRHPRREVAPVAPLPSPSASPPSAPSRESPRGPLFIGVASPPSSDEPVSACSKRCYYFQDLHRPRLQPHSRTPFPGAPAPAYHALRRGPRAAGQRHPFSARRDSVGTLQHVSSRMPTSMATAPLSPPRPRLRSLSCLRPLIPLVGSFPLAAHAYHRPPTSAPQTRGAQVRRRHVRSLLAAPTSSLPQPPARAPLSCETFRREPATRRFVWSFAPMPMSHHRVEHQNGSGRPPVFLPASASTGIVHRLSGPTTATHRSPTAPGIAPSPRRRGGLLGPCFNTGPSPRAPPTFTFHPLVRPFHSSLAVLVRYRTPHVFSLGCVYHPFALHYQAALLDPRACSGALTRCGRAFHRVARPRHNARRLSTGAHPCSVAPTTGIHVCFFSWP